MTTFDDVHDSDPTSSKVKLALAILGVGWYTFITLFGGLGCWAAYVFHLCA